MLLTVSNKMIKSGLFDSPGVYRITESTFTNSNAGGALIFSVTCSNMLHDLQQTRLDLWSVTTLSLLMIVQLQKGLYVKF